MTFNPTLATLQQYPFERLRALTADVTPSPDHPYIALTLGEPKHAPPEFVVAALTNADNLRRDLGAYPLTRGTDELRAAIAEWLGTRFDVAVDANAQVLPVNGTREALFAFAQATLSGADGSRVVMPNPFYQIYEGAALLAGAQPYFLDNDPADGYQQDLDNVPAAVWRDTELVYLCSPGNPTGQVASMATLQQLIELAHAHNFVIAADECYSELYFDDAAPPASLLAASAAMGNREFERCVVFHSLSKRSNLPGLRSGFVAGDPNLLADFLLYRTYHGCAMSHHHQHASALAWRDEEHVTANRSLYRRKFDAVSEILRGAYPLHQPGGGFYHWLPTPMDDQDFALGLLRSYNVAVMPGSYLGRPNASGHNPGTNHVRVAWVAPLDECVEAATRLRHYAETLTRP